MGKEERDDTTSAGCSKTIAIWASGPGSWLRSTPGIEPSRSIPTSTACRPAVGGPGRDLASDARGFLLLVRMVRARFRGKLPAMLRDGSSIPNASNLPIDTRIGKQDEALFDTPLNWIPAFPAFSLPVRSLVKTPLNHGG